MKRIIGKYIDALSKASVVMVEEPIVCVLVVPPPYSLGKTSVSPGAPQPAAVTALVAPVAPVLT